MDEKVDAERIAALLDRRLTEHERAEAIARLASSEESYEAFVDAVAGTRDLEASEDAEQVTEPQASVRPLSIARRPHWSRGRWLATAAAIVGIALVPWLWNRARTPDANDPGSFVALLESEQSGLPDNWNGTPWARTRAAGDPLTTSSRGIRLGARLVDFEVAVRAGDSMAEQHAADVAALLQDLPASAPVVQVYRDLSRRTGDQAARLDRSVKEARMAAARLAGEDLVALGAWIEAARIAAVRQDADYFRASAHDAMLNRAGSQLASDETDRAVAERIKSTLLAVGVPDWKMLERDLTELLRLLGS